MKSPRIWGMYIGCFQIGFGVRNVAEMFSLFCYFLGFFFVILSRRVLLEVWASFFAFLRDIFSSTQVTEFKNRVFDTLSLSCKKKASTNRLLLFCSTCVPKSECAHASHICSILFMFYLCINSVSKQCCCEDLKSHLCTYPCPHVASEWRELVEFHLQS